MDDWDWLLQNRRHTAGMRATAERENVDTDVAWTMYCKYWAKESLKFVQIMMDRDDFEEADRWNKSFESFRSALQAAPWSTTS